MSDHILRVADIRASAQVPFDLKPGPEVLDALVQATGLLGLSKVRFSGELTPEGAQDWQLLGQLRASVVQPCGVTLDPVKTRIEEPVARLFTREPMPEPQAGEVEMPEDDSVEALGAEIDLLRVLEEALVLALPPYPRRDGAELAQDAFTEPGKTPMTDADAHPFAGLKDLRGKLGETDG
jgi:uncharacterized metal-binding protein YceD (DUF177 family)